MTFDEKLSQIEELYADEKYLEVCENSMAYSQEALEDKSEEARQFRLKIMMYNAKAYLLLIPKPTDSDVVSTFYDAVKFVCREANSIEDILWIENEIIKKTMPLWKKLYTKKRLLLIESELMDAYSEYIHFEPKYLEMVVMVMITARNCDFVNDYCEKNNIEAKAELFEVEKNEDEQEKEIFTEAHKALLEVETANNIVIKANKLIEENSQLAASDYASQFVKHALHHFMVAELLLSRKSQNDKIPDDIKLMCMKVGANARDTKLKSFIYVNGQPMSLWGNEESRKKEIDELRKEYAEISKLDPDFQVPGLPDEKGFSLPTQQSQSSGCYVATAVYGSYDCPEVWTLRRFRDDILGETFFGRAFIRFYYAVSPTMVKWFGASNWFKMLFRPRLDKLVSRLNNDGVANTEYTDKKW